MKKFEKILNLIGEIPAKLQAVIDMNKYTVVVDRGDKEIDYVLTDNPDDCELYETPIILFDQPRGGNIPAENVIAIVNKKIGESTVGSVLFDRLIGGNSTLSFEKLYTDFLEDGNKLKLTDPYHLGYYGDLITQAAIEQKFELIPIRNFLIDIGTFLTFLEKNDYVTYPIEIDFGKCNKCFVAQVHCNTNDFDDNIIFNTFSSKSEKNDFQISLKRAFESVDVLDVYKIEQVGKIVLTGIWYDQKLKAKINESSSNRSLMLNNIESFALKSGKHSAGLMNVRLNMKEDLNILDVPDDLIANVYRAATFIVKNKFGEESVDWENLTAVDVKQMLEDYPNQETIKEFGFSEFDEIVELLQDSSFVRNAESEEIVVSDVDEYESILDRISGMSLNEAEEIIKVHGCTDSIKENITRVAGHGEANLHEEVHVVEGDGEDIGKEDSVTVKGEKEDIGKEEAITVKGEREDLADEAWNVKRSDVVEKLKKEFMTLKEIGAGIEQYQKKASDIIKSELQVDEESSSALLKDLAVENSLENEASGNKSQVSNTVDAKRAEALERQVLERNEQLLKMKGLIDKMNDEIKILRVNQKDVSPEDSAEMRGLLGQTRQLEKQLKNKDRELEDLRVRADKVSEAKDKEINKLNERIDSLQQANLGMQDNGELSSLKNQNSALKTELEMSKKRIEVLNNRIDNVTSNNVDETRALRENNVENISKVKDLEKANTILEKEVQKLKSELTVARSNFDARNAAPAAKAETKSENKEQIKVYDNREETHQLEQQIKDLTTRTNEAEKAKKDAELSVKKLEQKIKFMQGQIDQAAKVANKAKAGAGAGAQDAGLKHKVKQLERALAMLDQKSKATVTDLAEKKKEIHKYKTQNTTLSHKVKELEKKLGKFKKAG